MTRYKIGETNITAPEEQVQKGDNIFSLCFDASNVEGYFVGRDTAY
jgi:hypothetical protein